MKYYLNGKLLVSVFITIFFLSITNFASSAEKTSVRWLGHAGFEIVTPKKGVILIDPWLNNPRAPEGGLNFDKVNLVLVTHGHFDHFGNTSEIINKTGAELVAIFELGKVAVNKFGVPENKATMATLMNIGGEISALGGEVSIAMVPATHSSGMLVNIEGKEEIAYGGSAVGFIIKIKEGPTIYHTGDTGLFGDMADLRRIYEPTLLLVPIGDHFTMRPGLAANAVRMISPKWVIPMHFGTFPVLTGTPEKFGAEMKKIGVKSELIVLEPGKSREF
jgi:L-ascorbate metabolism protein UlaG (beta-lactamase superfamily)